ncbi:DNA helicase/exodeoxyribonuclease V, gamma subunit [Desulfocicer vacuolatum DSM 3385]|uniref:DNA helicase/exodeoxyribonuclease V, gamma subunit n=1 Tax=Desulfocicer vacuolatum DSM 3385 TaxID=1121400 RepID=A0A1W2BHU1_9BACT|nr:exodeoxyribonuclease V subunit gamma [Desulfocicer vacuolatum]SMC71998.1 DNA helicase/exodeoxyribonuclease V, gamma subunit [Desulfocicer vacuolatum DSM 3385]
MTQPLEPGLSIIHGNHMEDLRDVLVEWVGRYPVAPLEKECFIVQSNGMAQWLKLSLASDDGCGIGAGLEFLLPGRFMWQAYRAVLGDVPPASPFDRERLIWRLMRLLTQLGDDPVFSVLTRFFSDDEDSRKRYQLAVHLAALFDQYQVYRADWLTAWQDGRDGLITGTGAWVDLPREQAWQAALWRRVHEDIVPELRGTGRAGLHGRFLDAAGHSQRPFTGLPRRVIVFGICSLPAQILEALDVLSAHCQILLFVHNPCRHYWSDIVEDRELFKIEQVRHGNTIPGDLDPDALHQHVNPLLATWGKQGRDYIGLLYRYDQPETYQDRFSQIDLFRDIISPGDQDHGYHFNGERLDNQKKLENGLSHARATLLMQVQQNVLDLIALPACPDDRQLLLSGDRSIQFHLAHSRQREVEILQDQLLNFFEEMPDLCPRDVIVMTPDIDTYACHIQAVFGNIAITDERFIPFSIADGPDNAFRPLLNALETLLNLPRIRMTTADIMALMEVPALGRRFGIKPLDLPLLKLWMEGAGICWGLNSEHRKAFDLPPDLAHNTWDFGLRRMMLGYAVGNGFAWNGIEPYDEIGGLSAALAGGLTDLMNALENLWQTIIIPASPEIWCQRIRKMLIDFFMPGDSGEHLFLSHVNDVLVAWETACDTGDFYLDLELPVVRDHVMSAMTESSTSQRFLAGKVNFCTMMPMRAIPFKVVCLLGMNDGEYPRSRVALDFDLMAQKGLYRPGDRSRREDDRYLFLEALLSARNCFYISYIGHDVVDNSLKAPSVLVAQLRDYVSAGWRLNLEECTCRTLGDINSGSQDVHVPADHGREFNDMDINITNDHGMDNDRPGIQVTDADDGSHHGPDVIEILTVTHPLQPFSKHYFANKDNNALFTYAREWREIFEKQEQSIHRGTGLFDLSSIDPTSIAWDETLSGDQAPLLPLPVPRDNLDLRPLIQFMKSPLNFFFHQRLSIYFDAMDEARTGDEPFVLEGITPYILKQQLLDAGLAAFPEGTGQDVKAITTAAQRLLNTGELPMKGFGQIAVTSLTEPVEEMVAHNNRLCETWPHEISGQDLSFHINKGPLKGKILEGFLDGLHSADPQDALNTQDSLVSRGDHGFSDASSESAEKKMADFPPVKPSSAVKSFARWEFYSHNIMDAKGKPSRLTPFTEIWVKHVLACAVGLPLTSCLVAPDGIVNLKPLEKNSACALVYDMVDLWWQGLCIPLPITPRTAMAWLLKAPESGGQGNFHDDQNSLAGDTGGKNTSQAATAKNDVCKVYQGDGFRSGEIGYTPCALRAYPDFDSLWQAHNNAFPSLVWRLYGPLFHALFRDESKKR